MLWRSIATFVLATALSLQVYLRIYPYVKPSCYWASNSVHRIVAFGDPQITGNIEHQAWRKKLDILGNDQFLAQVAESVRAALSPEYVTVLGDLLSSQWIPTSEFNKRVDRYSNIFQVKHSGKLINITGNHDIGYHGELNDERVSRYEQRFGELNYVIDHSDDQPSWRIVVLNSLALDGPAPNDKWQKDAFEFLKSLENFEGSTVLLTHIPMYKPVGICRDGPKFDYYPESQGGGVKQQNHLSLEATNLVLNSVFGGRGGVVLTGHDHEGCETRYNRNGENLTWTCTPGLGEANVQEITVRSMMGEFGGNSGLLSAVVDHNTNELNWKFTLCRFHVQHLWWVTQVLTISGLSIVTLLPVT